MKYFKKNFNNCIKFLQKNPAKKFDRKIYHKNAEKIGPKLNRKKIGTKSRKSSNKNRPKIRSKNVSKKIEKFGQISTKKIDRCQNFDKKIFQNFDKFQQKKFEKFRQISTTKIENFRNFDKKIEIFPQKNHLKF